MRRFAVQCMMMVVVVLAATEFDLSATNGQGTPITNQTRRALAFYGGQSALNTLSEMPRRSPILPNSNGPMPHNGKPFQTASTGPTVSPYLNLFREEEATTEAAPSYYAFVRPQLEQQAANQQQQRDIQQLQRQLQATSATRVVPQYRAATVPGTGTPARFMDTAQFYGGWQR